MCGIEDVERTAIVNQSVRGPSSHHALHHRCPKGSAGTRAVQGEECNYGAGH